MSRAKYCDHCDHIKIITQTALACSKLTIKTLQQRVQYVQSYQ